MLHTRWLSCINLCVPVSCCPIPNPPVCLHPSVPASLCPCIPVPLPHPPFSTPLYPCTCVPRHCPQSPYVRASLYPCIPVSHCTTLNLLVSLHPCPPTSLCPCIPMSHCSIRRPPMCQHPCVLPRSPEALVGDREAGTSPHCVLVRLSNGSLSSGQLGPGSVRGTGDNDAPAPGGGRWVPASWQGPASCSDPCLTRGAEPEVMLRDNLHGGVLRAGDLTD